LPRIPWHSYHHSTLIFLAGRIFWVIKASTNYRAFFTAAEAAFNC